MFVSAVRSEGLDLEDTVESLGGGDQFEAKRGCIFLAGVDAQLVVASHLQRGKGGCKVEVVVDGDRVFFRLGDFGLTGKVEATPDGAARLVHYLEDIVVNV